MEKPTDDEKRAWREGVNLFDLAYALAAQGKFAESQNAAQQAIDRRYEDFFIADVPFMDSLSFTFLAYASFARTEDPGQGIFGRRGLLV